MSWGPRERKPLGVGWIVTEGQPTDYGGRTVRISFCSEMTAREVSPFRVVEPRNVNMKPRETKIPGEWRQQAWAGRQG